MGMTIIGWIAWLITGAIIGWLADRVILRNEQSLINSMVMGIVGAFIGGILFNQLGFVARITEFNVWSLLAAAAGAMTMLIVLDQINRREVRLRTATGEVVTKEVDGTSEAGDTFEDFAEPYVRLGRMRVHIALPALMILLLPLLDIALLMLRIPDISAAPPPFGTVATYQNEHGELDYLVYAPESDESAAGMPMLVLLHGCAQDPRLIEGASGMRRIADENNVVVVYPQQNFMSSPHRCWNWYAKQNQGRGSGEPSLIMGIVETVMADYPVDSSRVYVSGFSSGGAMTSILASCYRDVFAAAAVHSGMAYESATSHVQALMAPISGNQVPPETAGRHAFECSASGKRTIPVLEIHGTSDTTVFPINSEHVIEQFEETNRLASDGGDVARTGSESGQVEGGYAYSIEDYEGEETLLMQRYMVDGLGHLWAGGTGTYPLSDPKAPDATQIIWDFLSQHTLP